MRKKHSDLNIKAEKGASVSVKSANKKVVSIDKKKRAVICGTGKNSNDGYSIVKR